MKELLQAGLTLLVFVPYVLTAVIFAVCRWMGRSSVTSFRRAADSTVPFLIIATGLLLYRSLPQAGIFLAAGILVAGILYAVAERLRSKEFRVQLMLRNLWRMLFIVFSMLYVLLMLTGLILEVIDFTGE